MKEINLNQWSIPKESHSNDILSSVKYVVSSKTCKSGRIPKLNIDQVYECILLKSQHSIQYWKCVFKIYQKIYPDVKMPVYHNCLSSVYKFFIWLVKAINLILHSNRIKFLKSKMKVAFVDSTTLPVCHIIRSSRHKTMKDQAQPSSV